MRYDCSKCGGEKCKLWRESHILADQIELICMECLCSMGHTVDLLAGDQVYDRAIGHECWLPAVPDLDGSWWGYTSVPSWWVAWWKALPDFKTDCTYCNGTGKLADFECMFCEGSGNRNNSA